MSKFSRTFGGEFDEAVINVVYKNAMEGVDIAYVVGGGNIVVWGRGVGC